MVSVIIPSYNHGPFLARSIESVLAQTYDRYEVIVIDDGSTDDTPNHLDRYLDRIRYHRQENRGLGGARNKGLELAQGKYIQLLDADDSIAPGKFEAQAPVLEADEQISVVYSDYANLHAGSSAIGAIAQPLAPGESPLHRLIRENFMPVHSPLIRRDVLVKEGGFDESRVAQEDWDVWLRLASRGYQFRYLPGTFAYYHRDGSRMTTNSELMYLRGLHLLNKFMDDPMFRRLGGRIVDEFGMHQHLALAARSYNEQRWSRARRHVVRAILAKPGGVGQEMWALLPKTIIHQLAGGFRRN